MVTVDEQIYRIRFGTEDFIRKQELWAVLCRHWFTRFIPSDARVLDVGAGACGFINNIPAREKIAIDHNPDFRGFANPEVRCIVAELCEGLAELPSESVDVVMGSNVFEHLPDHKYLFSCLKEIFRVLRPGGILIVMQPNFAVVKQSFYDFSDHTLPLTDKGMAEAIRANGFEIRYIKARFLPYTTRSRYPAWPFLVRLYLRVPFVHWFMGGQMFFVAEKKGSCP